MVLFLKVYLHLACGTVPEGRTVALLSSVYFSCCRTAFYCRSKARGALKAKFSGDGDSSFPCKAG